MCQTQIRLTVPFANHLSFHPSRDTEKVVEPRLRRGLLHGRIYLRTFARMREEGGGRREEGGRGLESRSGGKVGSGYRKRLLLSQDQRLEV